LLGALLSFPPRRSSDLSTRAVERSSRYPGSCPLNAAAEDAPEAPEAPEAPAVPAASASHVPRTSTAALANPVTRSRLIRPHLLLDRKSTRLNSSHVKIS